MKCGTSVGSHARWRVGLSLWLLAATLLPTLGSTVNDVVATEMKNHGIVGVSIAITEGSEVRKAKGYGVTDKSAALATKSNPVISSSMTRQMLTVQKGNFGLGLSLSGSGKKLRFSHAGRDEGFDTFLMADAESGHGVVIMINANDNSGAVDRMWSKRSGRSITGPKRFESDDEA